MIYLIRWAMSVITNRPGRLSGTMAGVGLTVSLMMCLGNFMTSSAAVMTRRAIADVPVDWQVLMIPGADEGAVKAAISHTVSCKALERVDYAAVDGFEAQTEQTVQTTGAGKVLGLGPGYQTAFPKEIRPLTGASTGVLVAQQTAANLHVKEGDRLTIRRMGGLPPVQVMVSGVVDLPYADSLFQAVGTPPGLAPQAPPDNVVLMPADDWHQIFDSQARQRPDSVRTQYHVRMAAPLPSDPGDAYSQVIGLARHVESLCAGSAAVGNNLAASLAGARSDALYGRVLFLFLGLPGVMLAGMLTIAVAASGSRHRIREQTLLRIRGASLKQLLTFAFLEAAIAGTGGAVFGMAIAAAAAPFLSPEEGIPVSTLSVATAGSLAAGFLLALGSVLLPAWKQARSGRTASPSALIRQRFFFPWRKIYLDGIFLAISAFEFWQTAATGYQVVLAPEGVPQISVQYEAFLAPFFLWVGGALLIVRLWGIFLERGQGILSRWIRPIARNLSAAVAASLRRQRFLLTRGIILIALAVSFAVSTAVFNMTYSVQSRVDAELTNGADVLVSGQMAFPPGDRLAQLRALPGVAGAAPMMHRFAYVGHDLQDIYGIDPKHIGEATPMSNAFFEGGNARATLEKLARYPDGVLVSEETRNDFQLQEGDGLNLRVQFASDHRYHTVPFRFIGVVREFPTAPRDSFLVVNAAYLAKTTGSGAAETVLLRTTAPPADVADKARKIVAPLAGAHVTDIDSAQRLIDSGLTAVNLRGLTRLELVFAALFMMAATGLILAIGLAERRRNFAILDALGASSWHQRAFIWSEALALLLGGAVPGVLLGWGIAWMLVRVLTGIFDPPPEHLFVPWGYLVLLAVSAAASTLVAVYGTARMSRRSGVSALRKD